jgi:hypothetical protein
MRETKREHWKQYWLDKAAWKRLGRRIKRCGFLTTEMEAQQNELHVRLTQFEKDYPDCTPHTERVENSRGEFVTRTVWK